MIYIILFLILFLIIAVSLILPLWKENRKLKEQKKADQENLDRLQAAQEAATNADKENAEIKNNNIDNLSGFNSSIDELRKLAQKGSDRNK